MQKYWYLGFLGIIGIYTFPSVIGYFKGIEPWWELLNGLWLLWFLNFIPVMNKHEQR